MQVGEIIHSTDTCISWLRWVKFFCNLTAYSSGLVILRHPFLCHLTSVLPEAYTKTTKTVLLINYDSGLVPLCCVVVMRSVCTAFMRFCWPKFFRVATVMTSSRIANQWTGWPIYMDDKAVSHGISDTFVLKISPFTSPSRINNCQICSFDKV